MQTLDVISVNIWDIVSSLLNLVILFLLVKKFLYKPVKNILAKREEEINAHYSAAEDAERQADESRLEWEKKLSGAKGEADEIIASAAEKARLLRNITDFAAKLFLSVISYISTVNKHSTAGNIKESGTHTHKA